MKLSEHADQTEKIVGIRAEDIHKWIDGLFDTESFEQFLRSGQYPKDSPYEHRKHRHCVEALDEAYREFAGKYSPEQIKAVFECHVKDDYNGYLPTREDFTNGTFKEKYHEDDERAEKERILSQTELNEYFKGKFYKQAQNNQKLSPGFYSRIVVPTIIAIVLFVTSIFIIIVPVFRNNMMDRKKEMIKELTAAAASVLEYWIAQTESGNLTTPEAQRRAISEIGKMRYGKENKDYFWITDMHPKMVMHPYRRDLIGSDLTDYRDSENKSGKKLFVEFVRLVQANNEGYLEYLWQWMDDPSRTVPKLSYVRGIPEWGWIIGTGIYIDDIEIEMNWLTRNLLIVFGFISFGLTFLLANIVLQSRRIEYERRWAELGLREAKDRYRALVEASNEGYILEVAGENIFSNHTLQRMTGYTEEELASIKLWDLLAKDSAVNENGINHLKKLVIHQAGAAEFEAQLQTKTGNLIDVVITTSRIFFSQKNGHVISFRRILHKNVDTVLAAYHHSHLQSDSQFLIRKVKDVYQVFDDVQINQMENRKSITEDSSIWEALKELEKNNSDSLLVKNENGKNIGKIGYHEIARASAGLPAGILLEIDKSDTVGHVVQTLNRLPVLVKEMTQQGVRPETLRNTIGNIFDTAIVRFIELTLQNLGEPPVQFAFLSLGSNARHEMTLFSDQDNALIFEDVEKSDIQKVQAYFLKLADDVCTKLDQAGYPFCSGGIMAMNPIWCLSISEWKKHFADWILNASPDSILKFNVFFDIHCAYGEKTMVEALRNYVSELTRKNPEFFIHFAKNCLLYKPPLNLLGHIRAEKRDGGAKTINIKESLKPIELFARLYALKNDIRDSGTVIRLKQLLDKEILTQETFREMVYVFDYLWNLRFYNQIISHADLRQINDELNLEDLTNSERQNLKNVLSSISTFQTKINYDFFGGAV